MVKKEGRSVSEMMQEIFYMPTDEETVTHQRNFLQTWFLLYVWAADMAL